MGEKHTSHKENVRDMRLVRARILGLVRHHQTDQERTDQAGRSPGAPGPPLSPGCTGPGGLIPAWTYCL